MNPQAAPSAAQAAAQAAAASPHGFLSCAQVRDIDRRAIAEYGIPALSLMENAGRGAAATLLSLGVHGPVAICCGKGNNGGDGLVIARHLHNAAIDVKVLLFALPNELSPDAATNWQIVSKAGIPAEVVTTPEDQRLAAELARVEWVVDALFGTGLQGPVRPPLDRVIAAINAGPARIFAVDIPSGLDGDTGQPLGPTVRARHTATFVAPKKGYASPAAATWLGQVHVIDIGVPQRLLIDLTKEHAG
ncbi:MAG: NAD(P)H-hydrate epimerase [Gemmataceae bacterium]|nr:NAD(P)H-hydrate epimerase [Gemmataceae bacterium]